MEFPKYIYRKAEGQIESRIVADDEEERGAADDGWTNDYSSLHGEDSQDEELPDVETGNEGEQPKRRGRKPKEQ